MALERLKCVPLSQAHGIFNHQEWLLDIFDLLLLRVGHLLQNEFLDDGMKFFADLTQIWNKSIQSSKLVSQASSDEFSSMLVE